MNKIAILALASSAALVLPKAAFADVRQLEKRLEAVEAKLERMSALEAENKELKVRLQKTEAKLEKVTAQKVATAAPVRTLERSATPVTVATPEIAIVTPVTLVSTESNWSGVYAGINAGYGTGQISGQSNAITNYDASFPEYRKQYNSFAYDGPIVGGQVGYSYQFANNIVVGAETDLDYADIIRFLDRNNSNNSIVVTSPLIQSSSQYTRNGIDWLGTARLRLGYDLGNFMPYLTGGFAYGGVSDNSLTSQLANQGAYSGSSIYSFQNGTINASSNSSVQIGWTAGAGTELKVADHWSIRGEYLFTQLGGLSARSEGANYVASNLTSNLINYNNFYVGKYWSQSFVGPFGIHQARVGLNYHTDWLKNFSLNTEQR